MLLSKYKRKPEAWNKHVVPYFWVRGYIIPHRHRSPIQADSLAAGAALRQCLTLCNPMNHSTPGLPVHHQLPEFTQTHVHRVGDAIQPSHPLLSFSSCPQSLPALELARLLPTGGGRVWTFIRTLSSPGTKFSPRMGTVDCDCFILSAPFWGFRGQRWEEALWYEKFCLWTHGSVNQEHWEHGMYSHPIWRQQTVTDVFPFSILFPTPERSLDFLEENNSWRRMPCSPWKHLCVPVSGTVENCNRDCCNWDRSRGTLSVILRWAVWLHKHHFRELGPRQTSLTHTHACTHTHTHTH